MIIIVIYNYFLLVHRMEFFNDLYHRFLLSPKPAMKAMCLQAMAIVYGQCYEEIGPFNDTTFIVHKLQKVCLCVCMFLSVCVYMYCMCMYMYVYVHVCVCTCMCMYMYMYVYGHVHV